MMTIIYTISWSLRNQIGEGVAGYWTGPALADPLPGIPLRIIGTTSTAGRTSRVLLADVIPRINKASLAL